MSEPTTTKPAFRGHCGTLGCFDGWLYLTARANVPDRRCPLCEPALANLDADTERRSKQTPQEWKVEEERLTRAWEQKEQARWKKERLERGDPPPRYGRAGIDFDVGDGENMGDPMDVW